jgi:predicted nucleotidyltransferase
MTMLDLQKVDLEELCMALEDNSPTLEWWFDPDEGRAIPKSEDESWEELPGIDPERLVPIEPIPSNEAYGDMEEFVGVVGDAHARDLLARAIAGRGAFRRFKDTLLEFPELREAWFTYHDARMRRRAIEWLAAEGLVDGSAADTELERIEVQQPSEQMAPPDAREVASTVASELRDLYGKRMRRVFLFGSWARGEAKPESDLDLLVVLDRVDSPWEECERMNEILWRHSFENDLVVTALPLGEAEFDEAAEPVVIRAREEGLEVA